MSTFPTLGGCLGLSDNELEDIAHDVEFLEDHMDHTDEQRASRN